MGNDTNQPTPEEVRRNPLVTLGLGDRWQPTPSRWSWSKIAYGPGAGEELHILKVYNAGGCMGITLNTDQLAEFVSQAQDILGMPKEERLAVPRRPGLIVPPT